MLLYYHTLSKSSLLRPSQSIFLLATSKIDTQRSLSKRFITVPAESGDLPDKDLKALSHLRGHPRKESSILWHVFTAQIMPLKNPTRIN
jgi:hypothetical protein